VLHTPLPAPRPLLSAAAIAVRVRALGQEIEAAYPTGDLLLLGTLKGSFIFLADLVRAITRPLHVDFLGASSYGGGTVSSGRVTLTAMPATPLEGRDVLVVEDVVDSGHTLQQLFPLLRAQAPRSLAVCALLHKRIADANTPAVRFVGFDIPNDFVVGYGLDHAEAYRQLPYIGCL
jgi:hypoxanthine phosphoribosyltransferase